VSRGASSDAAVTRHRRTAVRERNTPHAAHPPKKKGREDPAFFL
jgi:hypothetical protein